MVQPNHNRVKVTVCKPQLQLRNSKQLLSTPLKHKKTTKDGHFPGKTLMNVEVAINMQELNKKLEK